MEDYVQKLAKCVCAHVRARMCACGSYCVQKLVRYFVHVHVYNNVTACVQKLVTRSTGVCACVCDWKLLCSEVGKMCMCVCVRV